MEKRYKTAVILGRFQTPGPHEGHIKVIEEARLNAENVLVLIGSAYSDPTLRNPFSAKTRLEAMKKVYADYSNIHVGFIGDLTHENDHSFAWGRFVKDTANMWAAVYDLSPMDCLVSGNDEERNTWFSPEDFAGITYLTISRDIIKISATEQREQMVKNNYWGWAEHMPMSLRPSFHLYREELLSVPEYREILEGNQNG